MSSAETTKALRNAWKKTTKAAATGKHLVGETLCKQCDPPQWVRRLDYENHRANYHRPGGWQYERRKQREKDAAAAAKAAEQAAARAEKDAQKQAAKAARPPNKEKSVSGPTNGKVWPTGNQRPTPAPTPANGDSTRSAPAAMSAADGVVQLMWTWARQVPQSIPASKADAAAAAEMWRQVADAIRARAGAEGETNRMPAHILEPYYAVAQAISQLGDAHMDVVKRIEGRYGQIAETLADPTTPSVDYLKQGVR